MRHLLPFDGIRASARLAALLAAVALLGLIGAFRQDAPAQQPRSTESASRVARGTPGLDAPGQSTRE